MNKTLFMRTIETNDQIASLALRIPAGIIFIAHGAQKLFGSFGGYGLEARGNGWPPSVWSRAT